MNILFSVTDPKGRCISCSQEQWDRHVVHPKPNMKSRLGDVKQTIENPDIGILQDAVHKNREIYYRRYTQRNLYVKVVVEFINDGGSLITAYETPKVKLGEELIWTHLNH